MKANSKKLLSLLLVVAMVLPMIPAITLPVSAATFDANTVCERCGEVPEGGWTALTIADNSQHTLENGGHYYLANSHTQNASGTNTWITVPDGVTACLNLNNATLKKGDGSAASGNSPIYVEGTLSIMGTGTIQSRNNTWNQSPVQVRNGEVNIYGGTYYNKRGTTRPSITLDTASTLNLFYGDMRNPICFRSTNDGRANIYGGIFTNNYTDTTYTSNVGTFLITGGTFNTQKPAAGHVPSCCTVGSAAPYAVTANHTKAAGDTGTVVSAATCTAPGKVQFTCATAGCGVAFMEETAALDHDFSAGGETCSRCSEPNPNYVDSKYPTTCPLCGKENVSWVSIKAGSNNDRDGGAHWYVEADATCTKSNAFFMVPEGTSSCLYLAATYTMAGDSVGIVVNGGTLYIGGTEDGVLTGAGNTNNVGLLYVKSGTVHMSGATISSGYSNGKVDAVTESTATRYLNNTGKGGNIYLDEGATFNMTGGTITAGTARNTNTDASTGNAITENGGFGGNVYIGAGATFNMTGGTISDGKALSTNRVCGAGNIAVDGGTFTMSGNSIVTGGEADTTKARSMGGNFAVFAGGAVNLLGGTVSDGSANYRSGNIEMYSGTLTLGGNATISGGVATSKTTTTQSVYMLTNKLTVNADWTGSAMVRFNPDTTFGEALPAEVGVSTGAFTGKLQKDNNESKPQYFGIDGKLVMATIGIVKLDGEEVVETWYMTAQEAVDAYNGEGYIRVSGDSTLNLATGKTYVVNNVGKNVIINGSGVLCPINTNDDDFEGTGTWTIDPAVIVERDVLNPVSGYRYLTIRNADGTDTTYRVELKLSKVTLRPSTADDQMGLYYKATISAGTALAGKIKNYGVVLNLDHMPGGDFMNPESKGNAYTVIEDALAVNAENDYTVETNSGAVFGIMKSTVDPEDNADRGEMDIFANAYLYIDLDGDGEEETVMADTQIGNEDDVAWSLLDVMEAIEAKWEDYAAVENAQANVAAFYKHWAPLGMRAWEAKLPKIAAAAAAL